MSKCNVWNNQLSGRVGDLVYFVRGGQQIVRSVPASVKNPRTDAQMLQRMKWANILAVYRALQPCLKDNFEAKAAGQTDYNRFVSINLNSLPVYLEKNAARMGAAVVAPYVVSQGSLPEIHVSGETPVTDIALGTLTLDGATTVGEFARAVVQHNDGFCYGDCLTFLMLRQQEDSQDGHPFVVPTFARVCLDPSDGSLLHGLAPAAGFSSVDGFLGAADVLSGAGVAWVHSRTLNGRTHVSSQRLVVENDLLEGYSDPRMLSAASRSYGGSARASRAGVPRFCAGQGLRSAGVEPVGGPDGASRNPHVRTDVQVEVDDGERAALPQRVVHKAEDGGREQVDAGKGQLPVSARQSGGADFPGLLVCPSAQAEGVVEEEVSRGRALAHEESGFSPAPTVRVDEGAEVGVGQDVGVVHQERLVPVQEGAGVEDASAGVQQEGALVADVDVQPEVPVGVEEVDDLLPTVVDVDGDVPEAGILQFQDNPLEERDAGHGHQGFGHLVGEGAEACAQPCGKYQGFHCSTIWLSG